jgi:mannose-1-phosphate guanylyltransferase
MDALLLAAGRGARLSPITDSIPKCLVPIMGRPLLDYWISKLGQADEINRIFINIHYFREQVEDFIKKSQYKEKIILVSEKELLGTGGTLAKLIKSEGPCRKALFVAHADNFSAFSVQEFLAHHAKRPTRCQSTVMTFRTDNPQSCGILEVDAEGVVLAIHEKIINPPGDLANAAVFLFEPDILDEIALLAEQIPGNTSDGIFDLSRDFLPCLTGRLYTFLNTRYHRDIGSPESLRIAQSDAPRLVMQ